MAFKIPKAKVKDARTEQLNNIKFKLTRSINEYREKEQINFFSLVKLRQAERLLNSKNPKNMLLAVYILRENTDLFKGYQDGIDFKNYVYWLERDI
jgi:hypothetical protein